VRLFTDVEDITLEQWLNAENAGKDQLAAQILDAGLLVEHMIAEIPLDQDLAGNDELRQLAENANKIFGLIVCFGCNRAFASKQAQTKNCPDCEARLTKGQLTGPS
jgi:cell wall assembly regulator SMI1